jgi:hypothetical protein
MLASQLKRVCQCSRGLGYLTQIGNVPSKTTNYLGYAFDKQFMAHPASCHHARQPLKLGSRQVEYNT